ncbi:DNA-directed RNA polymerase subunit beta [Bradymonadaceae bacterium TMQ3]|nr:DNA-directed RNA polymerase subunit beta [Bradymonadaceae bacterium TMQ3]TXC75282.1 DNA-directed RNA polymerase subunit beta [Bradymonadales bacterium TMQ1]
MGLTIKSNFRVRKDYGSIKKIVDIPNLIAVQRRSYDDFLQTDVPHEERTDTGLQGVFKSVFPIKDFNETSTLEFISYNLEKPKYDIEECIARGMTYAAPVKVVIRLVVWDVDEDTEMRSIRDVKEKEVFFGDIPLMTEKGTFIINGTERVIVSQLHRSPGSFFDHDKGKSHSSGKFLYSARVIPYRGSWLDFEFDAKDIVHVRIDRKRKMPATVLLRALGYSTEELLNYYYDTEQIFLEGTNFYKTVNLDLLPGQVASREVLDDEGNVLVKKGKKFTRGSTRRISKAGLTRIPIALEEVLGKVAAEDIFDMETGEILVECNEELTEAKLEELLTRGIESINVLFIDNVNVGPYLRNTLLVDKITNAEDAILEIYQRLRPGDPPTQEQAQNLFDNLFFNPERYDLSDVGRLKLNYKFHREIVVPLEEREKALLEKIESASSKKAREEAEAELAEVTDELDRWRVQTLREEDILETMRYLIELRNGRGTVDDIDHLGNRRVRTVGELLENQYRIGLVRMERGIKERMSISQDIETLMPDDLINAKPVSAVIKEYFGSSQLSQFMDQNNPLSEVTHKRRLSALGPGGLTRDRAGFEVRDVHVTHYGRICPIETPEGPNIGLIASLSTYARINKFGFVETPYRKVVDGKATTDVRYYSALEEENNVIAQANAELNDDGSFVNEQVAARDAGEPTFVTPDKVTLMDVSPNQLVSVGAGLIPFLENDDANRALMGSNMQRQAVPLMRSRSPLVGTGIEGTVARDSGITIVARHAGVVESCGADRIVVRPDDIGDQLFVKPDIYNLLKFTRSNQGTCFNQRPLVDVGDRVEAGEILADGPSTERGELALGQNCVVAFMPWNGFNFEDSILLSERLVKEDWFTSLHIEEYEATARDTKLGPEEITRDIPNVGEEALADLDEAGIVRIGAEVAADDILVGKITPKGESQLSPEEKLLRAIFGEKAGDVRDTSLRMPPGTSGTVIGAQVFYREGAEKDERTIAIEDAEEAKLLKDQNDEIRILRDAAYRKMRDILGGKKTRSDLVDESRQVLVSGGTKLTEKVLNEVPRRYWADFDIDEDTSSKLMQILGDVEDQILVIRTNYGDKIAKARKGDDLPPGVIKMVKVYVAVKRKLQVGDKMAGRHGNKGVISRILPEEDLPFLEDGTPVDVVLNPLGVPSRMNIGQILETHLGWAARGLGVRITEMLEEMQKPENLREYLLNAFKDEETRQIIKDVDDDNLLEFARSMKGGVHMATPVFDGAPETEIREMLELADLDVSGQSILYDGRTGEAFDSPVTVGVMYVLKLHHLVDDKIHARSIGPYSLVTQQPLGGKAQFGGQRLGEMEVWAIEAYGAAYTLQEFLTVKSDDVQGRTRIYESIVKGDFSLDPGLPESFNVLIKELHSLCLNVELLEDVA